MLARKYDYYGNEAWHQQEEEQQAQPKRRKRVVKQGGYRELRHKLFWGISIILAMYCIAVMRSETLVHTGSELIAMKQTEAELITKNSELRIQVEELKGPERITGIAAKQLGMSVARNNIYVKAGSK